MISRAVLRAKIASRGHFFLVGGALLCAALLILASLAPLVDPARFVLPNLCALLLPWWVVFNLAFCIYWVFRRRFTALIPLFGLLFVWGVHIAQFGIVERKTHNTVGTTREEKGKGLSVLSYNVNLFHLYSWSDIPPTAAEVAQLVDEIAPDILCLQEFTTSDSLFSDSIARHAFLPYTHIFYTNESVRRGLHHGQALFSRFPIVGRGAISFLGSQNAAIYADLQVGDDTIRVYNVHFQSFRLHRKNIRFIRQPYFFSQEELWEELSEILPKLRNTLVQQSQQVEQVRTHIEQSPYPILLCGDFNATPFSYTYAKLAVGLKDAFKEVGRGYGATFFTLPLPMRIDFMLYTSAFSATHFQVLKAPYSDHLPILGRFQLE